MENRYADYIGKIVQITKKNQKKDTADLVGRVSGEDNLFLEFGKNTYYYSGNTDGIVVSEIKIAEMGCRIHHNLVQDSGSIMIRDIEKIKILASD